MQERHFCQHRATTQCEVWQGLPQPRVWICGAPRTPQLGGGFSPLGVCQVPSAIPVTMSSSRCPMEHWGGGMWGMGLFAAQKGGRSPPAPGPTAGREQGWCLGQTCGRIRGFQMRISCLGCRRSRDRVGAAPRGWVATCQGNPVWAQPYFLSSPT